MNENREPNPSPLEWHRKPAGHKGRCPICGCPARRLKARHRAFTYTNREGERVNSWQRRVVVGFNHETEDHTYATLDWPSNLQLDERKQNS